MVNTYQYNRRRLLISEGTEGWTSWSLGWLVDALGNMVVGVVAGAVVLGAVTGFQKLRGNKAAH